MSVGLIRRILKFKLDDLNDALDNTRSQFLKITFSKQILRSKKDARELLNSLPKECLESIHEEVIVITQLRKDLIKQKLPKFFHNQQLCFFCDLLLVSHDLLTGNHTHTHSLSYIRG